MKHTSALVIAMAFFAVIFSGCAEDYSVETSSSQSESNVASDSSITSSKVSDNKESSAESSITSSNTDESMVEASWFDDAVFIGDSVTLKLSYYNDNGALGKAEFLCEGGLGYGNALWDLNQEGNLHPTYEGEKYTVDEGAKMLGAKKIFIMLGMNDIGMYGIDDSVENMKKLTAKVKKTNPDAKIYIESVTPMLEEKQMESLNNSSIDLFNDKLKDACADDGYTYLDVASVLKDDKGNLDDKYCSDPEGMGMHMSDDGCDKWVNYLKKSVEVKKENSGTKAD